MKFCIFHSCVYLNYQVKCVRLLGLVQWIDGMLNFTLRLAFVQI
jgi:hypothetical protein